MGLPMVGKGHRREIRSQEAASRRCRRIPNRIGRASSRGRSSANHQQPFPAQESSQNNGQRTLGTLRFRGTSSEGGVHPRRVHDRREELDSASLGSAPSRRGEDRRSGALAPDNRSSRRNQGQDQERDVGPVFTCGPLGILWPQSDLVGDPSGHWREERPKCGRAHQCQTPKSTPSLVTRTGQTRPGRVAIPGPAFGLSHRSTRYAARGGWSTPLDGLRLRQPDLLRPTLLLLAQGRVLERRPKRKHLRNLCPCIRR